MPGAGRLRNKVRFDQRGPDANGDLLGPWVPGFTVWAEVKWLRGGETAVAQRMEGKQPAVLVIRSSSQSRVITTGFRAVAVSGPDVVVGAEFNLTSVSPSPENGFIDVLGTTGGAAG